MKIVLNLTGCRNISSSFDLIDMAGDSVVLISQYLNVLRKVSMDLRLATSEPHWMNVHLNKFALFIFSRSQIRYVLFK